jgi:hypothetical protein
MAEHLHVEHQVHPQHGEQEAAARGEDQRSHRRIMIHCAGAGAEWLLTRLAEDGW